MKKQIIVANWKMNGSFDNADSWVSVINEEISNYKKKLPNIVLCPPAILIDYIDGLFMDRQLNDLEQANKDISSLEDYDLEKILDKSRVVHIGGQDCFIEEKGAFTGDISAKMLKDAGCKYVILGHSERRQGHKESSDIVAKKVKLVVENDMIPILCIGESKNLRDNSKYLAFLKEQIMNSTPNNLEIKELIIAYEPIWSIGTGTIPNNNQIKEVVKFAKEVISENKNIKNLGVLYGGSVNQKIQNKF